jgi:hypothetical protein
VIHGGECRGQSLAKSAARKIGAWNQRMGFWQSVQESRAGIQSNHLRVGCIS